MAQLNSAANWIIKQDVNGQPQVLKLVQAVPTTSKGINGAIGGQQVKMYRAVVANPNDSQAISTMHEAQVMKTFGSKIQSSAYTRTPDGKVIARAVKLTPQQMQNVRFINSSNKQYRTSTPSSSDASRKRPETFDQDFTPDNKRRKTEKIGKGLRHFSMKVCEKVKIKRVTTYNEVADELVNEFANFAKNNSLADQYDQKNIRRRVYDALNVLMAMKIITKDKKEIIWNGLPSNAHQEYVNLEQEKQRTVQRIKEKTRVLQELVMNQISFKSLAARNKQHEQTHGIPSQNSYIQLPFIVVNTNKKTVIDCSISHDKMEYHFHFNDKFEMTDDINVLKKIGMLRGLDTGDISPGDVEELKALVPESLQEYVDQLARGSFGLEQFDDMVTSAPIPFDDDHQQPSSSSTSATTNTPTQHHHQHRHLMHEYMPSELVETSMMLMEETVGGSGSGGGSRHSSGFDDPLSPGGATVEYTDEEEEDEAEEEEPLSEDPSSDDL